MAGYSGTPLAKKLGIRDGSRIFVSDAPANFLALLAPLPDRVTLVNKIAGDTDIVHIFSKEKDRLSNALVTSLKKMKSCTSCHADKTTAWARDIMKQWPDVSPWRVN